MSLQQSELTKSRGYIFSPQCFLVELQQKQDLNSEDIHLIRITQTAEA